MNKELFDTMDNEWNAARRAESMEHPDADPLQDCTDPDAPKLGDYVQLLDASGTPCENHTEVYRWTACLGPQLYLIEDPDGESFAVTRLHEWDNQRRRAWQQVITAAPVV